MRALQLQAEGAQALRAGQLGRLRELIGEVGRIEDANWRYFAQSRLVRQGLDVLSKTATRRAPALLATIAEGALGALEGEPREPLLLDWAGVALYELWALEGAEALFEAALRLDPQHPDAASHLAAVGRRRRKLSRARARSGAHSLVPVLVRRALQVAERAQLAAGLRLSLCMIVRDEEEMLPRCLTAVAGAVDEMVIVDTGSQDRTIEIARSFGARVIEHPWSGSFAEARNVSFDAARGDWLIYLDADEVLAEGGAELLRSLTGRTWREAFYVRETSYTGHRHAATAVDHDALRVFRNRPDYRFSGRLHEQIARTLPGHLPERLERTAVQVEHYGYLGEVAGAREKSKRNLQLLRAQQAEGVSGPFLEYNLGVEMMHTDDPCAAVAHFERAWRMLQEGKERRYSFVPALARQRALSLLRCGRAADAIAAAREALERLPGFTDLVLIQAHAHALRGDEDQAIADCERCIEMGDAPRRYSGRVGSGTDLPRVLLGQLLLARGEAARAADVLGECLHRRPGFLGAALPYAEALLAGGAEPAAVVARIEAAIDHLPAPARFPLGVDRRERMDERAMEPAAAGASA